MSQPAPLPTLPRTPQTAVPGTTVLCIGNNLAPMEAMLILATVLQKYRLDLLPGHPVSPQTKIFLHPRHGMQMTIHPVT